MASITGRSTLDLETELGKKITFVAKWSKQGDKKIIIVPTEYHDAIEKLKNPLRSKRY